MSETTKKPESLFLISKQLHNNGDPIGTFNLGLCYEEGIGTKSNCEKAFQLYTEAHLRGIAPATNNLGCCYLNGIGTEIDIKKAYQLFMQAHIKNNTTSTFNLARFFHYQPQYRNIFIASLLYETALSAGYADAEICFKECQKEMQQIFKTPLVGKYI